MIDLQRVRGPMPRHRGHSLKPRWCGWGNCEHHSHSLDDQERTIYYISEWDEFLCLLHVRTEMGEFFEREVNYDRQKLVP